jgi:hypothetical protein
VEVEEVQLLFTHHHRVAATSVEVDTNGNTTHR